MLIVKKIRFAVLVLSVFALRARADIASQVRVDFFYSPGCSECDKVKRDVLPALRSRFRDAHELVSHDMTQAETIPLLIAYQDSCGNTDNGRVSLVVDHTIFLSGYEAAATGLVAQVAAALRRRGEPGWKAPRSPLEREDAGEVLRRKKESITWSVVIGGGLLDGINPCAISTLIFFMSVLVVSKAARGTRLMVGISFITASFLVYTALGLGFLYVFRRAPNFPLIKKGVDLVIGLLMLPLAALSFRDAFRFRHSQRPDDVTLQIPKPIKERIHRFMNSRLGWGGPVLGGLVTGAGVTVLESVCTGQSYIPVLNFMLREERFDFMRLMQLVAYNLCFVLPLIIVFVAFHRGVEIKTFIAWSKRNLVVAKILIGIFFLSMAAIFLWPLLLELLK